eukprot:2935208-Rhodomonas_salina.1
MLGRCFEAWHEYMAVCEEERREEGHEEAKRELAEEMERMKGDLERSAREEKERFDGVCKRVVQRMIAKQLAAAWDGLVEA